MTKVARGKALYVDLPKCTAIVADKVQNWRRRKGHMGDTCWHPAKYEIDGRPLCSRHAGQAALKIVLE